MEQRRLQVSLSECGEDVPNAASLLWHSRNDGVEGPCMVVVLIGPGDMSEKPKSGRWSVRLKTSELVTYAHCSRYAAAALGTIQLLFQVSVSYNSTGKT